MVDGLNADPLMRALTFFATTRGCCCSRTCCRGAACGGGATVGLPVVGAGVARAVSVRVGTSVGAGCGLGVTIDEADRRAVSLTTGGADAVSRRRAVSCAAAGGSGLMNRLR